MVKKTLDKINFLSEEQKKEFIIKDNLNYGEWDWDILANWDNDLLDTWGLDLDVFGGRQEKQECENCPTCGAKIKTKV